MVAALGGPGVVNGPLVYTAIDAGVKSFSVRYTAAGAYGLTFTSATTSISVLLEVTVFSDVPSRISTRRTPTSAQWSVKVPVASFEVSLTDADGLLAVSDTPVAVTLALGTQKPRPARLTGTTELTFAPGERRIVLRDDLVITKPGVYSIEGRADGYELGALEDFAAYYRSPVVTFDGFELEADNCVRVDYTVTQPDNVPVDVFVRIGDGGDVYATQAAASSDVAGTYRLQSGSHSFLWNAPNDIGTLSGDLTVSARVNDDRMLHSPVGALRGFALSFKQGLVIEDRPGPAERTRDVGVGQFDGDSIGDVAYSTERAVHIAFSDDTFLQTTPDHAGYGQLDVADMDFDGESEIAVVDGAQIAFLSGSAQPLGGFTPCVGSSPVDVVFGNFDGRDALDLAVLCDTGTGFAAELYRKSSGWTRFARVTGAGAPRAIAVADLQRDGRNDLLIGTALGISSLLARTVAAPQYVDFNAAQSLAGPPIERLAVGETTNDIYIDVVAVHDDGTASQFSSTGNDLDPLALRGDVAVAGARDVLLADADGDGNRDDIFSTDGETYFVRRPFYGDAIEVSAPAGIDRLAAGEGIVVGAGTGSAGTPFSYLRASAPPVCQRRVQALQPTPPWHDVASLTVDDMNDDGKLDIIGAGRLALGRGDGSFAPDYRAIGADPDARITTGDFNGDGLRDYVRSLNGSLGLYVRKPEVIPLGFEPIGMLTLGLDDVAVDDMDGDGRDDIVFVDEQSYLAVAYQTASTGTTGVFDIEQVVQLGSVGLFRDLAIGDLDSRGGLDIAYVKIDEVAPGDLQHSLCTLVSQQYRGYLAPSCTRLDAGLDFAARSALRIEDLAIDQSLYCARSAFYRYEPGLNSGHLEARALGVEGPQAANVIDICPGGRPFSYAFGGLFDSLVSISVVASDVVATCLVDGNTNVGVWLRNADPFSFTAISVEPGASPIALRDFDGDPLPELATSQGTVDLDTSDGISGTKPTYVSAFNDGDVDATLNGDFSGRGFEELVAVSIYDASDTYLQVDLFHTSAPGASTWSTRVCSDCPQGRQWRVRTERGDIDGDGRDDIVIAYGTDGEDATLVVLKVDASGNLAQIASPLGGDLGVTSFELAVGRVLPGSRADIVVVGTRMAIGELFIVHYEDNAWREYGRSNATVIPRDTPSIAIGDFRVRGKGEIAIVDGQQIVLFGAGDCSATSSCFAEQHRLVTVGPDSNMGRTRLATIPGDRVDDLAVLATLISEGSTSLLVMVKSWDDVAGVLVSSLLAQRDYDGYSCADGYDEPCVPSAFGPYVADFDRDGALDVFIGWRDGMTWEAFTANGRVLVAASDDHRAAFANVFDVDRSGFPDIIIFDAALPDALWQMTR